MFRRRRIRTFATLGEPGEQAALLTSPTRTPEPGSVIGELERIRAELPALNENDLDFYVSLVDAHEEELA